jgi:hypothetical protein
MRVETNGFDHLRRLLTDDEQRTLADEGEELRVISARFLEFFPGGAAGGAWQTVLIVARAEQAKRNRETRVSAARA